MNKNRLSALFVFIFIIFTSISFASKKREIINALGSTTPAKMDIEITKVKSTNYLDFYIDRSRKKIFRDISNDIQSQRDLEKKLYVTTYLKPNTKSNTLNDDLEHEIITSNGKRYLQISYSDEPEKIYLWVVKNSKVEKLYTGILKEVSSITRADGAFNIWSSVFSNNETFSFEFQSNNSVSFSNNLYNNSGQLNAWKTVKNNNSVKIIVSLYQKDNLISTRSGDIKLDKTNNETFSWNELDFNFLFSEGAYLKPELRFKDFNFDKIIVQFRFHNGPHTGSGLEGEDILTINFFPYNFNLEADSMDFGEISNGEEHQAFTEIRIINGQSSTYSLSIPDTTSITTINGDSIILSLTEDKSFEESGKLKVIGTIPIAPNGTDYPSGTYTGVFTATVTVEENKKGGRF